MKKYLDKLEKLIKDAWHLLPKELRVALFITASRAINDMLAEVVDSLEKISPESFLGILVVNVSLVLIKVRTPQIRAKINGKK